MSESIEMGSIGDDVVKFFKIDVTSFICIGLFDHFLKIYFLPFEMTGCSCSSQSGKGDLSISLIVEEIINSFDFLATLQACNVGAQEEYKFLEIDPSLSFSCDIAYGLVQSTGPSVLSLLFDGSFDICIPYILPLGLTNPVWLVSKASKINLISSRSCKLSPGLTYCLKFYLSS